MYIIDETYFIKELVIPNSNEIDISESSNPFEMWIDQYARLCLQEVLGNTLFTDLDQNVTNGVLNDISPQKWLNLVNGASYIYKGKNHTWKGLIFEEGTFKGSLLAYFVYCKWLEFQLSQQSGIGEVRGDAINATSVGSTHRYVSIWNQFVSMYQGEYQQTGTFTFIKGVPFYDYYNGQDYYVSLLEFLKHNEEDYPDAPLKEYNYLNTFGL